MCLRCAAGFHDGTLGPKVGPKLHTLACKRPETSHRNGDMTNLARSLERRGRREMRRLSSLLVGEHRFMVSTMALADGLIDPRLRQGAAELLLLATASAAGPDQHRQCFGCMESWTPERPPVALTLIEILKTDRGLLCGLCASCATSASLEALIRAGLHRDLGLNPDGFRVVAPPSRA